jgi:hypothetical protein
MRNENANDVLLSYIGMDSGYQQGRLMYIAGKEDAAEGNVGTLQYPALGFTVDPAESDPVLFSYVYTKGGQSSPRVLLVKITDSPASAPAPAKFSVLVPRADGEWTAQTVDVTLAYTDAKGEKKAVVNPHGLAQAGDALYLVDFESQDLIIASVGELETAADGEELTVKFVNLSEDVPVTSRGQAIIAVNETLYALYLDTPDEIRYRASILLRLDLAGNVTASTLAGQNAQAIVPVSSGGTTYLLIPAIGGQQRYDGTTNEVNSNISYVEAEAKEWPSVAPVLVTGDPAAAPPLSYDIHGIGAGLRNGSSAVFILTQIFDTADNTADTALWRIYRTTVADLLKLASAPLSKAGLTVVDEGSVLCTSLDPEYFIPYGVTLWDILYEQVPGAADDEGDRVWVAMGSPILVTRAGETMFEDPAYGSPTAPQFRNPFAMFGLVGGVNVNMGAFDLTIEAVNQARRGVSLKRGFRKAGTPRPTEEEIAQAQARIAQAKK